MASGFASFGPVPCFSLLFESLLFESLLFESALESDDSEEPAVAFYLSCPSPFPTLADERLSFR